MSIHRVVELVERPLGAGQQCSDAGPLESYRRPLRVVLVVGRGFGRLGDVCHGLYEVAYELGRFAAAPGQRICHMLHDM